MIWAVFSPVGPQMSSILITCFFLLIFSHYVKQIFSSICNNSTYFAAGLMKFINNRLILYLAIIIRRTELRYR
jgi:hypothetical protein